MEKTLIAKGASLTRPPTFIKEHFPYWKDKIDIYVKSTHYQLWQNITMILLKKIESKMSSTLSSSTISQVQFNLCIRLKTTKDVEVMYLMNPMPLMKNFVKNRKTPRKVD